MTRKRLAIWVLLLLIVIILVSGFIWVRGRGFSAKEQPSQLEAYFARNARRIATPSDAASMKNPRKQTDNELAPAYEHFVEHCAVCHGATGRGDSTYGPNMYPKVPDLTKNDTQKLSDGEIYYIINNGVRFTGMPAFSGQDSADEIWDLVSLIRKFPTISNTDVDRYLSFAEKKEKKPVKSTPPPSRSPKTTPKPHKHQAIGNRQ